MSKKPIENNLTRIKSGIYEKGTLSLDDVVRATKNHPNIKNAGSIFIFTGIVRNSSLDNKEVKNIQIDSYVELANKAINDICENLKKTKGIIDVKIIHFKGFFDLSEDLVYVIVASAHRQEGVKVLKKAIEAYKKEVAVWKKELYIDGTSKWVH